MDLSKNVKYLNKEEEIAVLFLEKEKFDPNNFFGERFKKAKGDYVDRGGIEVLENPNAKNVSYKKELIENSKKMLSAMGYSSIKMWLPSSAVLTISSRPESFLKEYLQRRLRRGSL